MPLYSAGERRFLETIAALAHANPFLPERVALEQEALGDEFVAGEPVWSASVADPEAPRPNVRRLHARLEPLIERLRERLAVTADVRKDELTLYEECTYYVLYTRYYPEFVAADGEYRFWASFLIDWQNYLLLPGKSWYPSVAPAHLFACFWQVQRAFHAIFDSIIGSSLPAARLRAQVWESIFTHDLRRYRRTLYDRMADFSTLITGPSGTGKELVARAIAGSRYVPFDPQRRTFAAGAGEIFHPINVAALSPTLVESELFGHKRGSFTGAIADRQGWLEACPPQGSVFLDELGEMDPAIQVKLLRVIETRRFAAVGDTRLREFHGKLITATHRDLGADIQSGRFREDLYYRLCADLLRTPSLQEQLRESPEVWRELVLFMARRAAGGEAEACAREVDEWRQKHLPPDYAWPGNYRELEQCVRNIVIRGSYSPVRQNDAPRDSAWTGDLLAGRLSAEDVLSRYVVQVYRQAGSYEEAARRLGMDRRTVKAKVAAKGR